MAVTLNELEHFAQTRLGPEGVCVYVHDTWRCVPPQFCYPVAAVPCVPPATCLARLRNVPKVSFITLPTARPARATVPHGVGIWITFIPLGKQSLWRSAMVVLPCGSHARNEMVIPLGKHSWEDAAWFFSART